MQGWLGGILNHERHERVCCPGVLGRAVVSNQWSVISGQLPVVSGQWGLRLGGRGSCRAAGWCTELVLGGPGRAWASLRREPSGDGWVMFFAAEGRGKTRKNAGMAGGI